MCLTIKPPCPIHWIPPTKGALIALSMLTLLACAPPDTQPSQLEANVQVDQTNSFSIIAIPDTQNYLDYTHQKADGFALDAADQFMAQMRYIAGLSSTNGGDVAFVTHLGDVWQHQTIAMDAEHKALGFKAIENKWL